MGWCRGGGGGRYLKKWNIDQFLQEERRDSGCNLAGGDYCSLRLFSQKGPKLSVSPPRSAHFHSAD